jgi:hypothetical protein
MQIIVLGSHRSGTSLFTRLINMMGGYFGGEDASIGFNTDNPKGFWERKDVVACNDALLTDNQCSWDDTGGSTDPYVVSEERGREIKKIILEMDAHRPWVMKDPRLCLTLSSWMPHLEIPLCLFIYRDPLEIARSLQLRNGFSLHHGLALWEHYTVAALNAAQTMPQIFMTHEGALTDPVATTQTLYDALIAANIQGLRLPSDQEILAFVESKLYRSKNDMPLTSILSAEQLELIAYARGEKTPTAPLSVSKGALDALAYYRKITADQLTHHALIHQQQTALAEQNARLADQLQALATTNEALRDENHHLQHSLTELHEHIHKLVTIGSLMNSEQHQLMGANAGLNQLHQQLASETATLTQLLDRCLDIRNSTSWRIGEMLVKLMNTLTFRPKRGNAFNDIEGELHSMRHPKK